MSRDKQIEEMANDYYEAMLKARGTLGSMNDGAPKWYAKELYAKGYCKIKTTDWLTRGISAEQLEREKREALDEFAKRNGYCKASEIFEEIDEMLVADIILCDEGISDAIKRKDEISLSVHTDSRELLCVIRDGILELKKKYEREGADDDT